MNNAGLGELTTGRIHGYHKHPLNELCLMSNLNAVVPSIMFKMILPRMESNKLGLCIMMGSGAGMAPIGTLPVYGATKSFVMHLTKSLRVWVKWDESNSYHLTVASTNIFLASISLWNYWYKLSSFHASFHPDTNVRWTQSWARLVQKFNFSKARSVGKNCDEILESKQN